MQSLADLEGGYQIVQSMRVAPFTLGTPLMLAAATLIPIAPLVLTMMPMEELLNKLIFTLF